MINIFKKFSWSVLLTILSVMVSAQTTVTLDITEDALINSLSGGKNRNYANYAYNHAWHWTNSGEWHTYRSVLKADLSPIPAGATITGAKLKLYSANNKSTYSKHNPLRTSNTTNLHRITESWEEGTVTWNNQPAHDANAVANIPRINEPYSDYVVDITTIVQDWYKGVYENHGLLMRLVNENSSYTSMCFASSDLSDATKHPKLEITYIVPVPQEPAIDDYLSYWKLDGDATDETGTNNGIIYGAIPARDRFNQAGGAMKFDGNDNINLGSNTVLDEIYEGITLSTWVKIDGVPGQQMTLISKGSGATENNYNFSVETDGRIRFWYGKANLTYSTTSINDGNWHHISAIWDGNSNKIFIDGAIDGQKSNSVVGGQSGSPVYIGTWNGSTTNWAFNGSLDDIRIYNRALSGQEVNLLYETEKGPETNDYSSYWKLDGNASDETGTNNGIINGATPTRDRYNQADGAMAFDGNEDYIRFDHEFVFKESDPWTITLWLDWKGPSLNATQTFLFWKRK